MNDTPADYRRMAFIEKQGKAFFMDELKVNLR